MATMNPFDLLGDFDNDDPLQLIAKLPAPKAQPPAQSKLQSAAQPKPAKLPTKPLPPSQAVREAMNGAARGGGRGGGGGGGGGGGRGYGRGRGGPGGSGGGYRRDSANDEKSFSNSAVPASQGAPEDGDGKNSERRDFNAPRGPYHGGRRGGFGNGEGGDERPRRVFERRSGTGRGNEFKREGSGRGNWGIQTDEVSQVNEEAVNESEKNLGDEKPAGEEVAEGNKENPVGEPAEKEPEEKEMTLEEYQKLLEEKRKTLQALKTEERKVDTKEFESMQQLSNKKDNDDVFIKLGSDKDKRKEAADKEDKAKKSVSINEFLKPAEGERSYNPGGRGRGRGRGRGHGSRGEYSGGSGMSNVATPSIEDPRQFPTLGGK